MSAIEMSRVLPHGLGNDVIVEQSDIADGVQIFRKKEVPAALRPKIRVAAYCRVSTELEQQQKSLDLQMSSYKQIILEHPGWELAGIYADPGVTGTSVKKRKEFLRMIEDAKAGKIDRILAKSTSRFARNTEDTLKYTRMLRSIGVGVYFDKEKIDTMQTTSEILLTVYAAFSQEESRDISESEKAGFRMRAKQGKAQFSKLYGYTSTKTEKWIIVPEEAEVVRRIYDLFVKGFTTGEIARMLTSENIPSPCNCESGWSISGINDILKNEKYAGDILIQKTYTEDHLTHRRFSNRDMKLPQYFVPENHTPIVDREVYEETRLISRLRSKACGCSLYPYYGFLVCPECGEKLVPFPMNTASSPKAWFCPGHLEEGKKTRGERSDCPPFVIYEKLLNETVLKAMLNIRDDDFDPETQKELPFIRERIRQTGKMERYYLNTMVKRITLADWRSVKIVWKSGRQTVLVLNIKEARKHPLPKIEEAGKWETVYGGVTYQNRCIENVKIGIKRRDDYVNSLIIEKVADDPIPRMRNSVK